MSASAVDPKIVDDKSPICVPFIRERLRAHQESGTTRPFIIGLNGVQGVGKTTLVQTLAETLRRDEGLETLVCSIDDFYLTHDDQVALAASMPDNMLVQVRGEPGMCVSKTQLSHSPTHSSYSTHSPMPPSLPITLFYHYPEYLLVSPKFEHLPPIQTSMTFSIFSKFIARFSFFTYDP